MKGFIAKGTAAAVAIAILAGGMTVSNSVQASPGMMCKSWVSGTGAGQMKHGTKIKARKDWRIKVKGMYGPTWSQFGKAQKGAFTCNKAEGMWYCNIRAKPCKEFALKQ